MEEIQRENKQDKAHTNEKVIIMNYKIQGAINKNKKTFIFAIVLWIFISIVFIPPLACCIFAATYNGGFQIYLGKNGNIVMKIGGGNEYSLDNPNCIIDANSNFSFIVKNDAAGNVSVSLTNASGVTGTKSVVAAMNTFSSLSSALSVGTNITSLKIYAGDIPSPFKGCSNLVNIYVSEGNKNFSSVDGVLYNKDATKLIFYPEGRKTAVDAVVSQHKESLTYNIDGVKVGSVVNSRVYIKNGKKVYIDCK